MYAINLHFIPTLARGCLSSQTLLSAAPLMGGVFFDKLARSAAPGGPAAETQLRNPEFTSRMLSVGTQKARDGRVLFIGRHYLVISRTFRGNKYAEKQLISN